MRTYFESHIDYSEVKFVTTNKELLAYADGLMKQINLSNGKKLNLKPVNRAVRQANFFKRLAHKLKKLHTVNPPCTFCREGYILSGRQN